MGESPIFGLPWPELSDPADVPAAIRDTSLTTDGILNGFQTDTETALDDMQDQITGATGSFVALAHAIAATNVANFDLQNIPQQYTDLIVTTAIQSTAPAASDNLNCRVNGLTATNYYLNTLMGTNNIASSAATLAAASWVTNYVAATAAAVTRRRSPGLILLPSYSLADHSPAFFSLSGAVTGGAASNQYTLMRSGEYNAAVPINRLTFFPAGGAILAGSELTLYGLKGA